MTRNSRSKGGVYSELSLGTVSEDPVVISSKPGNFSLEQRKKQAEEPIYLDRI